MSAAAYPGLPGAGVPAAQPLAGHNRVSTQALTRLAQAAAAAALGVQPSEVRAEWSDDAGLLALRLVAPIAIPHPVLVDRPEDLVPWGGSVWERAARAKGHVLDSVMSLSGAMLSRVDIRISGVRVGSPVRLEGADHG